MHSVDFPGTNLELTKPEGWTDEQCGSLRAWFGTDDDGNKGFLTAWMPNKEDLEAMAAGRPLYMKTLGTSFSPVAMFTVNENDEPNI